MSRFVVFLVGALVALGLAGSAAAQDGARDYRGKIHNQTVNADADVQFALQFSGRRVTGTMILYGGLNGGGRVEGTRDATRCEIRTQILNLRGVCDEAGFSGTYTTTSGQRGRFDTRSWRSGWGDGPPGRLDDGPPGRVDDGPPGRLDTRSSTASAQTGRANSQPTARATDGGPKGRPGVSAFQLRAEALSHGLTHWYNEPPTDLKDGRTFFATAGLDEAAIRATLRPQLGPNVRFLPVHWGYAQDGGGQPISEFILPFCVASASFCHEPYDAIDGALVIDTRASRTDTYLYYYWERQNEAVFCKAAGRGFDCRPGNQVGADPRFHLVGHEFQGIFEDMVGGYEQNPNRYASAQEAPASNPHLACVDYSLITHSSYAVNGRGDYVPGSGGSSQWYAVKNTCRYRISVTIQLGDAGGCQANFANTVSGALVGDVWRGRLAPGESQEIGTCKGVLTDVKRATAK